MVAGDADDEVEPDEDETVPQPEDPPDESEETDSPADDSPDESEVTEEVDSPADDSPGESEGVVETEANSSSDEADGSADASDEDGETTEVTSSMQRDGGTTNLEEGRLPEKYKPPALRRESSEPPDDVEMPLTEHIEEMLSRIVLVAVVGGLATLLAFPFAGDIVTIMWYDIHPGSTSTCVPNPDADGCVPPHVYAPLDLLLTEIRVAALAGIVVALPVFVYQTYQFMRPGLYPNERRYYLASIPTSLVLALIGMAFAYFAILPLLFSYFLFYSEGSADIHFALVETFDIMLMLMAVLAIVFQIPLFIMLAIMMGVTTRQWLESRRIYFWIAFGGIAFIFSPDPTGMAPVLVGVTMVFLFEGTLLMLRWTGR